MGAVASYTLSNISATHSISATFSVSSGAGTGTGTGTGGSSSYTVSASPGPNGTVSPAGSVSVSSGSSQTFTITPTPGYSITSVLVDGASVGAVSSYTFSNVTANHTISATFALTTQSGYSITASAGSNGSISPSGAVSVNAGSNQIFAITPAAGYEVSSVLVDGTSIGSETAYTFYKVSANHAISASFAAATAPPIRRCGAEANCKRGECHGNPKRCKLHRCGRAGDSIIPVGSDRGPQRNSFRAQLGNDHLWYSHQSRSVDLSADGDRQKRVEVHIHVYSECVHLVYHGAQSQCGP